MSSPAPIAVALDLPTLDEAVEPAAVLTDEVAVCKVGLELFGAHGPEDVRRVGEQAPVFLDLTLHDIPTTVRRAARVLGQLGVAMLTMRAGAAAPGLRPPHRPSARRPAARARGRLARRARHPEHRRAAWHRAAVVTTGIPGPT